MAYQDQDWTGRTVWRDNEGGEHANRDAAQAKDWDRADRFAGALAQANRSSSGSITSGRGSRSDYEPGTLSIFVLCCASAYLVASRLWDGAIVPRVSLFLIVPATFFAALFLLARIRLLRWICIVGDWLIIAAIILGFLALLSAL